MTPLESVMKAVLAWQRDPEWDSAYGLCCGIQEYVEVHSAFYIEVELNHDMLVREYAEYSLDDKFPVPSPDPALEAGEYYVETEDMSAGLYGASRKRLLKVLQRAKITVERDFEDSIVVTFK